MSALVKALLVLRDVAVLIGFALMMLVFTFAAAGVDPFTGLIWLASLFGGREVRS
ncbi:hypothetical protein [Polymorphobacter sp.]|uniref:hypothetical protein n=1 Tax=Polymorphobacter sp. TaxID=1909290 RepID=UPI003F6FB910